MIYFLDWRPLNVLRFGQLDVKGLKKSVGDEGNLKLVKPTFKSKPIILYSV